MTTKKGIHFEISERKILLRIFDALVVLVILYTIGRSFEFDYFTVTKENWSWSLVLAIYITLFGSVFELYDLQASSKLDITFKNIVLTASVTVLVYLLTPIVTPFLPEKRIQIIYFYIAIIAAIFLWRIAYVTFIASPRFYKRVLVVGDISNIGNVVRTITKSDPNYRIIGFINSETSNEEAIKFKGLKEFESNKLFDVIQKESISEILVAIYNPDSITPELYNNLISLLEHGFVIREYSQVYENLMHRLPIQYVGRDFYKFFPFSRSNQNRLYLLFSRTLDIITSLLGLLFLLVLLPFILLGNLMANKGNLLYKQDRVGKNGEIFQIVKLRTMIKEAEKEGIQWAEKNDSRVTSFGRILRNTRLDEIPQFWNVLKGEMALIGPRPERPFFVKELSTIIPFYETRHIIKPGLTGWAQVKMRYGNTVDDSLKKLQYDLFYIKRRSFFLDINVIVKTISTILYYRGQ
jgi:exopolysaccharide biosynthesis polyprenyl glycosylphosphotransferase